MAIAEKLLAQTYPVYEQRYKADPNTPFKLFDCLMPELSENYREPIETLKKTHEVNIGYFLDVKRKES